MKSKTLKKKTIKYRIQIPPPNRVIESKKYKKEKHKKNLLNEEN